MSQLIAIRLPESLLRKVDRVRKKESVSRTEVVRVALEAWIEQRRYADAVRSDHRGYDEHPVTDAEFEEVLGAQSWPK